MENYGESFIRNRNNRVKKISSEPDAVIKRATSGSRAIGSRPMPYAIVSSRSSCGSIVNRCECVANSRYTKKLGHVRIPLNDAPRYFSAWQLCEMRKANPNLCTIFALSKIECPFRHSHWFNHCLAWMCAWLISRHRDLYTSFHNRWLPWQFVNSSARNECSYSTKNIIEPLRPGKK